MNQTLTLTNRPTAEARRAHRVRVAEELRDKRGAVRSDVAPETVAAALASLTAHDRDELARIARREARRWAVLSIDAADLATDALLRWLDPDLGGSVSMVALLRGPSRGTALARYRMVCRSIVTSAAERAGVYVRPDERVAAAIEADGPAAPVERDASRRWHREHREDGERPWRSLRERGNVAPHDVGSDGGPVRLVREQSLEAMLTSTLRIDGLSRIGSSPDGPTAGRTVYGIDPDDYEGRRAAWNRWDLRPVDLRLLAVWRPAHASILHALADLLDRSPEVADDAHRRARGRLMREARRLRGAEAAAKADPRNRKLREVLAACREADATATDAYVLAATLDRPGVTLADVLAACAGESQTTRRGNRETRGTGVMAWRALAIAATGRGDEPTQRALRAAVRSLGDGPTLVRQ